MCAKGKHKTERDNSPGSSQNLAEQSGGSNLLNSRLSIASVGNSVFDEIDNVEF